MASELDFGAARRYTEYSEESPKSKSRRAGILLIIAGCVLMALAAGDAVTGDHESEPDGLPQASITTSATLYP